MLSSVDLFNPKVIRSTMGSVFRVPFLVYDDLGEAVNELKKDGVKVYAAHLDGKNNYDEESYETSSAFLIGNESKGLSEQITAMADCLVKIPMEGQLESLNAAVSAALLMYESRKNKRK